MGDHDPRARTGKKAGGCCADTARAADDQGQPAFK
jgi:hypothetical protein